MEYGIRLAMLLAVFVAAGCDDSVSVEYDFSRVRIVEPAEAKGSTSLAV